MDEAVPVEPDAGLHKQPVVDAPAVFGIGGNFRSLYSSCSGAGPNVEYRVHGKFLSCGAVKHRLVGRTDCIAVCQECVGLAVELSIVGDAVEMDSELEVVTAQPLAGRQI